MFSSGLAEVIKMLESSDPYLSGQAKQELIRLGRHDLIAQDEERLRILEMQTSRPLIEWKKKDWTEYIGRKATEVYTNREFHVVRFYSTDIFVLDEANRGVRLDNGRRNIGRLTMTTKERIQEAGRLFGIVITIYQRNFVWYVSVPIVGIYDVEFDTVIEFQVAPAVLDTMLRNVPEYVRKWKHHQKKPKSR